MKEKDPTKTLKEIKAFMNASVVDNSKLEKETNIPVPSEEAVENAKKFVDENEI